MTDTPPPQQGASRTEPAAAALRPASPVRRTAVRAARAGVSLIWIVPFFALLVTMILAWNAYSTRGTLVSVSFSDATGVTPGDTTLKFREITVGKVEAVRFTPDLQRVIVDLRVDKDVAQYIDDEAEFWIVRPQVSTQGISRLDTVLTGAFIEGWWDADPGSMDLTVHTGLEKPPLTRGTQKGTWFVLAAENAKGMNEGAPIYYRGLRVGQMQNLRMAANDERVVADAFVEAPFDARLTSATVFWDVSGFGVSLGTQGVQLRVNSVASLLQGGAEFATATSGGQPVGAGHVFTLQPDEDTAKNSLFTGTGTDELRLTMLLPEAVKGLTEGADVQFQGLTVGRVSGLAVRVVPGADGRSRQVLQDITLAISPQRLGLPDDATTGDALSFLASRVTEGLRARVTGSGFFGTSLIVELVTIPDATAARIAADAKPYPIMPSAPPNLADISDTAQGLMARIGHLKIEELLKSATDMMNSVTAIASSQDTREIPKALRETIGETQVTMTELRTATQELRKSGVVENISGATDKANKLADKLNQAADRVPGLVATIDRIAASLGKIDFPAIATDTRAALGDFRGVIGSDAALALPGKIATAVDSVGRASDGIGSVAAQLRDDETAAKIGTFLDSAGSAADAVKAAAADVPEMVDKIDSAATSVDEFDFAGVSASVQGLVDDLRRMLGTEDAAQLPRNLSDTLKSASALLNDLREGGAAKNLNATLASGRRAMDEVARAANTLPQLSARYQQLAARAEAVIASFGDRGAFNTELINTLRSLRNAAQSFGSLSSTIERNPRAFILGR